uniref:Transposase zinc-ribbon domain-containing protein n=1 Tax=Trichuris muris TaxID=70415 RepID=A0A5S6QCE4_TRIMR
MNINSFICEYVFDYAVEFAKLCAKFVDDELAAVQFMQSRGLMHERRICPWCARPMVLQHCRDRDYVGWWCNGKHCQKELSVKTGTWFQGCEQPVRTMLLFMRAWSESLTTLNFIFVRERRFAAVVQVGTKEVHKRFM